MQSDFIVAFECGERQVFFRLWEEHVPPQLRESDPTAQHLECNISAYFAVYPIRTGVGCSIVVPLHFTQCAGVL